MAGGRQRSKIGGYVVVDRISARPEQCRGGTGAGFDAGGRSGVVRVGPGGVVERGAGRRVEAGAAGFAGGRAGAAHQSGSLARGDEAGAKTPGYGFDGAGDGCGHCGGRFPSWRGVGALRRALRGNQDGLEERGTVSPERLRNSPGARTSLPPQNAGSLPLQLCGFRDLRVSFNCGVQAHRRAGFSQHVADGCRGWFRPRPGDHTTGSWEGSGEHKRRSGQWTPPD